MSDFSIGVFSVGVNSLIKDPAIADLRFANQDALNFSREIKFLFPVVSECTLTDVLDADTLPLRSTIIASLKRFVEQLVDQRASMAIFFFTGHGVQTEDDLVFCGRDFDPFIPLESGVRLGDVFRLIKPFQGNKVIILDCCRSHFDSIKKELLNKNVLPSFSISASLNETILFSCMAGQTSVETGGLGSRYGGVFIHNLMETIRGATGPYYCFGDSFQEVREKVAEWASENQLKQAPCSFGGDLSDFVFQLNDYQTS